MCSAHLEDELRRLIRVNPQWDFGPGLEHRLQTRAEKVIEGRAVRLHLRMITQRTRHVLQPLQATSMLGAYEFAESRCDQCEAVFAHWP